MNFDTQGFFISLLDLYSITLPSVLHIYLLMSEAGPVLLGFGMTDSAVRRPGLPACSRAIFSGT